MFRQTGRVFAIALTRQAAALWVLALIANACGSSASETIPNGMTRDEFEVVRGVIAQDSSWRLAVETDSKNMKAVAELRGSDSSYQPYFCRRSLNGATAHFSFVLVRADTFRVIYVNEDGEAGSQIDEVARATWLDDGQVSCREDGIDIGPFNSDELLGFRWNAGTRKLEHSKEEPVDAGDQP